MTKKKPKLATRSIRIDEDLYKKVKASGMNLNAFVESHLIEHFEQNAPCPVCGVRPGRTVSPTRISVKRG